MRPGITAERIGHALQALASDLVTARREVTRLRREIVNSKPSSPSSMVPRSETPNQLVTLPPTAVAASASAVRRI